ncbi:MAG: hypothetical protein AVDCRST_MAG19-2964, partial [uncultured Thermomicrobiales bacterium]
CAGRVCPSGVLKPSLSSRSRIAASRLAGHRASARRPCPYPRGSSPIAPPSSRPSTPRATGSAATSVSGRALPKSAAKARLSEEIGRFLFYCY